MTIKIYWRLDVTAENSRSEPSDRPRWQPVLRDVRTSAVNRYDYYAQIARAAEITGLDGLFIPHRVAGDDSQIVAAAVARAVPRLTLVPEFPATVGSAVYAAKQAVSFQRLTHNRLGWAISADDAGVERTREFLQVARGVHGTRPFSFKGRFFEVQGGGFDEPLNRVPFPPVFLSGDTEEAIALSAALGDVHLLPAGHPETLRPLIATLGREAQLQGRSLAIAVNLDLHARESDEEAAEAGSKADVVGSYDTVARHLADLVAAGVDHFVLSAKPSFEEAYRIGQFVLPRLHALTAPARAA